MRRREHDEEPGQERWLVSYADFITLMFAFFAVLYATSNKDFEKTKEFQESIKKYLIKAGAFGGSGPQMAQGDKHISPIESPIATFKPERAETTQTLDEAETFLENELTQDERKAYILDLNSDEWGVRLVIPTHALFAKGSDRFQEPAIAFMTKLSQLLAKSGRKILVEGHVAGGEQGDFRSSWDLASARAVNALRLLERTGKLPGDRLAAVSLGSSRPLTGVAATSTTHSRIEIVLLNSDMEL